MTKENKIKKLSDILSTQTFADFYSDGGEFDNWIRHEASTPEGRKKEEAAMRKKLEALFVDFL